MITLNDLKEGDIQYIEDGAYVNYDGFGFWLVTNNGEGIQNRVYLEPLGYQLLIKFMNSRLDKGEIK